MISLWYTAHICPSHGKVGVWNENAIHVARSQRYPLWGRLKRLPLGISHCKMVNLSYPPKKTHIFVAHIIFLHFADSNNKNNNQHELTLNDAKKTLVLSRSICFSWLETVWTKTQICVFVNGEQHVYSTMLWWSAMSLATILLPSSGLLTMKPPNWNLSWLTRCTALAKPKKNQDLQRWGLNPDFTIENEDLLNILSNKH